MVQPTDHGIAPVASCHHLCATTELSSWPELFLQHSISSQFQGHGALPIAWKLLAGARATPGDKENTSLPNTQSCQFLGRTAEIEKRRVKMSRVTAIKKKKSLGTRSILPYSPYIRHILPCSNRTILQFVPLPSPGCWWRCWSSGPVTAGPSSSGSCWPRRWQPGATVERPGPGRRAPRSHATLPGHWCSPCGGPGGPFDSWKRPRGSPYLKKHGKWRWTKNNCLKYVQIALEPASWENTFI